MPSISRDPLYYRVGWTYPARNPIYISKSIKFLVVLGLCLYRLDRSDPPVRPIGRARLVTGTSTGQTASAYRSDRSVKVAANFGRQQLYSITIDGEKILLSCMNIELLLPQTKQTSSLLSCPQISNTFLISLILFDSPQPCG